jgi:hypothetical protein
MASHRQRAFDAPEPHTLFHPVIPWVTS